MSRDYTLFPDDSSGDALWEMSERGDDMSLRREIEFTVIFPTESEALDFGNILLVNRQQVLLCDNEAAEDYPFEIVATVAMVPNYKDITEYESLLQTHANALNGVNDGWGCYPQ